MNSECPKCGSRDIVMGSFPLSCACGWHHLNCYQCDLCDEPARGAIGFNGNSFYRCAAHPFTVGERHEAFRRFVIGALT